MSGIGFHLRETREAKGYTLEQVQQSTKIHIEYLRALENDQFDSLPSPFYVRAFLRTYAHCLGLDAKPLVDRYERATVQVRSPHRQPSAPQATGNEETSRTAMQRPFRGEPRLGRTYSPRSQRMTPPAGQPASPPPRPFAQQNTPSSQTQRFSPSQQPIQGTGPQRTRLEQPIQKAPGSSVQRGQPPHQPTGKIPVPPPAGNPSVEPPQETTRNTLQGTQRLQLSKTTGQPVARTSGQQERLQQTMTPRKVSLEVKRGVEEGDGKGKGKKGGASKWMVRVASIGALVLVSIGGYTILTNGSDPEQNSPQKTASEKKGSVETSGNGTANAQVLNTPQLAKAKTGDDLEGDLFTLENAKKIEVEIKAVKGNTNLSIGTKVNKVEESYEIKVGERRKLKEDKFIWFRLMKPSDTQIKVNGEEIDTTAQDVPKSYRIELK